jgi:CTP:molybdopterin cytidylyltransferase MocA
MTVAGLLLAAGAGTRLGRPKALVELDGELLVRRGFRALRGGGCDPVVVVLGADADEVLRRDPLDEALVVRNDAWRSGMGSSLRAGLLALYATPARACVVLLVDTPGVGAPAVKRLTAAPAEVAVGSYRGRRGHPVRLARRHWAEVATRAEGDVGARPFLAAHPGLVLDVPCDDVGDPRDIDTPADLAAYDAARD